MENSLNLSGLFARCLSYLFFRNHPTLDHVIKSIPEAFEISAPVPSLACGGRLGWGGKICFSSIKSPHPNPPPLAQGREQEPKFQTLQVYVAAMPFACRGVS